MKKRLFASCLAALMLVTLLAPGALAEETEEATGETEETLTQIEAEHVSQEKRGTCGEGISWELDGNVLRIHGSGKMKDGCPWEYYKDKVKKAVFSGGITYVGANSFQECENLVAIDFGDSLHTIGAGAFQGCTELESIQLPESFRKFGQNSFRDCTALETVYCDGPMPSFQGGCLWTGNHITIYTPLDNPWPSEAVQETITNFGGRLEVIAGGAESQYEEPYVEEVTEAPTEAPTEPETVPPTEAPTLPTVPPATVPPTEAPTEPVVTTEAIETTAETTEPQPRNVAEEVGGNGWIGMVLIAGVFTFLIAGSLIFRSASRKGGKYTE